jgi:hypothetical protein
MTAPKYQIESYINNDCDIVVNDISLYFVDGWHVALFWSIDNWSTIAGGDLTDPADYEWIIPSINQEQYSIYAFYAFNWTDGGINVWPIDGICYDHGGFYLNISGGTVTEGIAATPPHLDPVKWKLMDDTNYADFVTAMASGTNPIDVCRSNEEVLTISCHLYTVTQSPTCYEWKVCDVSGIAGDKVVNIYAYGSTTILATYTLAEGQCVTVTLPNDGVYVVDIMRITATEPIHEYHLAYEICKIKTCWATLVNSILCNEWDPCCMNSCSDAQKEALRVKRDTLNMMIALFIDLMASMLVEHTQYMNILLTYQNGNTEATRATYIQRVKDNIERLLLIVGRCGECTQTPVTTTTSCSTC